MRLIGYHVLPWTGMLFGLRAALISSSIFEAKRLVALFTPWRSRLMLR